MPTHHIKGLDWYDKIGVLFAGLDYRWRQHVTGALHVYPWFVHSAELNPLEATDTPKQNLNTRNSTFKYPMQYAMRVYVSQQVTCEIAIITKGFFKKGFWLRIILCGWQGVTMYGIRLKIHDFFLHYTSNISE